MQRGLRPDHKSFVTSTDYLQWGKNRIKWFLRSDPRPFVFFWNTGMLTGYDFSKIHWHQVSKSKEHVYYKKYLKCNVWKFLSNWLSDGPQLLSSLFTFNRDFFSIAFLIQQKVMTMEGLHHCDRKFIFQLTIQTNLHCLLNRGVLFITLIRMDQCLLMKQSHFRHCLYNLSLSGTFAKTRRVDNDS